MSAQTEPNWQHRPVHVNVVVLVFGHKSCHWPVPRKRLHIRQWEPVPSANQDRRALSITKEGMWLSCYLHSWNCYYMYIINVLECKQAYLVILSCKCKHDNTQSAAHNYSIALCAHGLPSLYSSHFCWGVWSQSHQTVRTILCKLT